ncbi:MAG: hypothetical protein HKO96_02450 [Flavobacteriaceae bacterium]|nr:hypothetical protein [Flavobacteriaceae bacterium]NNK69309.1 hypothetical protein [Flavobacteriaceae bacterium]
MKKITTYIILLFFVFSCNDDDINNDQFLGTWSLINYQCCKFSPEIFSPERINYTFFPNFSLDVQITGELGNESLVPIQENGIYSYSLELNKITIDGREYDYSFEEDLLILMDNPEADGPIIIFTKN